MLCPLCECSEQTLFDQDSHRHYYLCSACSLVFVDRGALLNLDQEKARYDHHENSAEDSGYREYLQSIYSSIRPRLSSKDRGLDFGCGKTTVLADFFEDCDSYDIFFLKDESIWTKTYDFIILSEVIEHLREPKEEMAKLFERLSKDGKLFIKTKFYPEKFHDWFYKRDQTHVQFFSPGSMNVLGDYEEIGRDLYQVTRRWK